MQAAECGQGREPARGRDSAERHRGLRFPSSRRAVLSGTGVRQLRSHGGLLMPVPQDVPERWQ